MAQIIFPSSPSISDTYTAAGKTWEWDGSVWVLVDVLAAAFGAHTGDTNNPHQTTFSNLDDTSFTGLADLQIPLYSGSTWYNEDIIVFEETVFSAFSATQISATTITATTLSGSLDWTYIDNKSVYVTVSATTVIDEFSASNFDACQWLYSAKDSSNMEAGNIIGAWDMATSAITDTQYGTNEIGSTTGITFDLIVSGTNINLVANVVSGSWDINLRRLSI